MTTMTAKPDSAPRAAARAEQILDRVAIMRNPYFAGLRGGGTGLERFRESQEQFYFAVIFFSRPMAALAGRIPHARDRLDIIHNILEEHGNLEEKAFHATTFKAFLRSIGSEAGFEQQPLAPPVRAFNCVLAASCALDALPVAIGCMGVIERAYADISALMARIVIERGWVGKDNLAHYKLHTKLDIQHSQEFFALLEPYWDNPRKRGQIEQGLELGAYAFDRLYRDLHRL